MSVILQTWINLVPQHSDDFPCSITLNSRASQSEHLPSTMPALTVEGLMATTMAYPRWWEAPHTDSKAPSSTSFSASGNSTGDWALPETQFAVPTHVQAVGQPQLPGCTTFEGKQLLAPSLNPINYHCAQTSLHACGHIWVNITTCKKQF